MLQNQSAPVVQLCMKNQKLHLAALSIDLLKDTLPLGGSVRLLPLVICLLVTIFATALPVMADNRPDPAKDFQILQNNTIMQPNAGLLKLTRRPFSIRYTGKGTSPSIYAGFNAKLETQFRELHDPLLTFAGTGSAAYPSQLYVDNDALDLYQGWSAAFDKAWGAVQGSAAQTEYAGLRNRLSSEPAIIMSGRNYTNFQQQADGTYLFTIHRINDSLPPFTDIAKLYLLLFVDDTPANRDASVFLLNWSPLIIVFSDT